MSDMNNLYRAYGAVHNSEIKEELNESRDLITQMDLTQMTKEDLIDIAEEIVEKLFREEMNVHDSYELVASTLEEAVGKSQSEVRNQKISRLAEAFDSAFDKVEEKSPRYAVESFLKYRDNKPLVEKWEGRVSHEVGNKKLHESLIAQDRLVVVEGLLKMFEGKKKDDSYLETDMKKRQANNEKARKDLMKGPQMKNPHFEEIQFEAAKDQTDKQLVRGMMTTQKAGHKLDNTLGMDPEKEKRMNARLQARRKDIRGEQGARIEKDYEEGRKKLGMKESWASAYTSIYEKKLDPVGQEDKDIDNDGDHDSTDKYLHNRRKAIGKAMGKKKDVKEGADKADEDSMKVFQKLQKKVDQKKKPEGYRPNLADVYGADRRNSKPLKMKKEEVQFSEAELEAIQAKVDSWDIEESQYARNNPEKYEREVRKTESSGQRAERRVRDRLKTMDPKRAEAMKKQMRAVGLDV